MRLLEYRDEADLRFVFAALAGRLPPSEDDSRRESALLALERCANALGVSSPSSRNYARWRATAPEGRGAPSVQRIRTIFDGSWNHACEALPNVPSSDPLVRRLAAIGPRYTDEECLAPLARWHQETGELNTGEYKTWARRTRKAEPKARIPANHEPVSRRFGNWCAALAAAGIDRPRTGRPARTRPTRVTHPTREEVVDSVRLAYEEIGEPFSELRYVAWRDHRAVQHGASPAPFRVPSPQIIIRTFGRTWGEAVTEILGDQLKAVAAMRQRRTRFSPTDLARAWWECHQALGRAPSLTEYERWRHSDAERTEFKRWRHRRARSVSASDADHGRERASACSRRDPSMPDASEVAFVLAELVSDRAAFPDDAASDLRRVLGHRIATPTPAVLRYDRLHYSCC